MRRPILLLGSLVAAACGSKGAAESGAPTTVPSATVTGEASVAAPADAPKASATGAAAGGPSVTIPAGRLVAGTACGDHPRMPSEEPAGVSVELGAFEIDVYPYPNDPAAPALTGVDQAEAEKLCAARGRRLCTELEWERACKGPKNTRYEYGARFEAARCSTKLGTQANGGPVGALATCKSGFDVAAMHGFAFEWTRSAWGRNAEGDRATLRGGFGNQPFAHLRCSAAKASPKDAKDASIGFRCCGGAENAAKVELAKDTHDKLEAVDPIEPALGARFLSAMKNGGVASDEATAYAVEKAWRWHPVPSEELFVAKVAAKEKGSEKARYLAVVLELCEKVAQLSNKARGLVDEMGDPEAKSEPVRGGAPDDVRPLLTFGVKAGADSGDVRLEYQFGQVVLTQPPWVGVGAPAAP